MKIVCIEKYYDPKLENGKIYEVDGVGDISYRIYCKGKYRIVDKRGFITLRKYNIKKLINI